MSNNTWLATSYISARPRGVVNRDQGRIDGVSVTTEGEAKGHGVHLDEEFIDEVVKQGNEKKQGVKARFGHPNMCSTALGTFIGRFKNFRKEAITRDDGQKAFRAIADLFMSNSAKETPNGNLYEYVFNLAESEADMFGTSIVFTPGGEYRRDVNTGEKVMPDEWSQHESLTEEVYVMCQDLHACDAVDDPAANDGLFSRFAQETVAGQITEFLDLHPEVWGAVRDNADILGALGRYSDKMDEFIERYNAYREQRNEGEPMKKNESDSEQLDAEAPDALRNPPESTEEPDKKSEQDAPAETDTPEEKNEDLPEAPAAESEDAPEEEQPAAEPAGEDAEEPAVEEEPPAEQTAEPIEQSAIETEREQFKRMKEDFGAEIASEVFENGGSYSDALKVAYDRVSKENETLRKQVGKPQSARPTSFHPQTGMNTDEALAAYKSISDPKEKALFREQHAVELGIK